VTEQETKYWFRAKRYGWGWGLPITWQRWTVLISWLVVLLYGVRWFAYRHSLLHLVFACCMVILVWSSATGKESRHGGAGGSDVLRDSEAPADESRLNMSDAQSGRGRCG
jgi:hypothetical protein